MNLLSMDQVPIAIPIDIRYDIAVKQVKLNTHKTY